MESLKLFSLYFTLAPKACLDGAEGQAQPDSGVGEEEEALQAGPAPWSPSDAHTEHGPAAPNPVQLLGPSRWAPLLLATKGC